MDVFTVVAILVLLVAAPAIVVNRDLLFVRRSSRRAPSEVPLPFLIIPSYPDGPRIVSAGISRQRAAAAPRVAPESVPEPSVPDEWIGETEAELDDSSEEVSPDATIVFTRPVDEPVQILPGRLHVLSGEDSGEDLHLFSKLGEQPRIVVGREKGPPHRHITLHSPTVSRRHARMEFVNGSWTITNLSSTNPVLVNDRVLKNGTSARKLSDGDRIELGEVALRFLAS
jgi:hypothetical protein